jgi:hypothetical protein
MLSWYYYRLKNVNYIDFEYHSPQLAILFTFPYGLYYVFDADVLVKISPAYSIF